MIDGFVKLCVIDIPVLHAVQGNSKETDCIQEIITVFKSCLTDGCTSESIGCLFAYSCCSRGEHEHYCSPKYHLYFSSRKV